jgi:hypothetical protein
MSSSLSKTSTIPNDPAELKKLIAQLQDAHAAEIEQLRGQYESEVTLLREQIHHLYNKRPAEKKRKESLW